MTKNISKADVELRVYEVFELLLRHYSRPHILQYSAKTWDIKTRQADEYIKRARQMMYERIDENALEKKARYQHELDYLYQKAFTEKNYLVCKQVKELQAKLDGLMVENVKHSGEVGHNHKGDVATSVILVAPDNGRDVPAPAAGAPDDA